LRTPAHPYDVQFLSADDLDSVNTALDGEERGAADGPAWADEFEDRFAEARGRLTRVVASLVGPTDADDVVQDTYLIARRRIAQLRDRAALEAWLFRIAINTAYTRKRRARSEAQALPRMAGIAIAPGGRDAALIELVERLPPAERALVVLHYGHGYHLHEVGELVGLTAGAVKAKLFRALRRLLRQLLEGSDD
jgi:RNA polymerase sigma-70 factor (ECF subfamily)